MPAATTTAIKVPFLPESEWERARTEWGSDATGRIRAETFDEYRGSFESMLEAHTRVRGEHPAVIAIALDAFLTWTASDAERDPASPFARLAFADVRADAGDPVTAWPPGRNDPCWCGSSEKYKRCCTQRATESERTNHARVLEFDAELLEIVLGISDEMDRDPAYDSELHLESELYPAALAALQAGLSADLVERSVREFAHTFSGPDARPVHLICLEATASAMSAHGEHRHAIRIGMEVVAGTREIVDAGDERFLDDLAIRSTALGSFHVVAGDPDAAAAAYDAARREFPDQLAVWELAADVYEDEDELGLALTWATEGLERAFELADERATWDLALQRVRIRTAQGAYKPGELDRLDQRVVGLRPEFAEHPLVTGKGPGKPRD